MGIINTLFGNASEVSAESLQRDFGPLLCPDEQIEKAYSLLRDKWVFTNRRLIIQNVQGVTGRKKEFITVPYNSVERFSIETTGTFDMDSDLKLWIRGSSEPLTQKVGKNVNIYELQAILATYTL